MVQNKQLCKIKVAIVVLIWKSFQYILSLVLVNYFLHILSSDDWIFSVKIWEKLLDLKKNQDVLYMNQILPPIFKTGFSSSLGAE